MKLCFIDTEFTLIVPKSVRCRKSINNEIVQIGAVLASEDGRVLKKFSEFVHPQYTAIATACRSITGICDATVRKAPPFNDVCSHFMDWIGSTDDLVTFAWSDTDFRQFRGEAAEKKFEDQRFIGFLSTMKDYQKIFHDKMNLSSVTKNKLSLRNAVLALDLPYDEKTSHDALEDALTLFRLYKVSVEDEEMAKRTKGLYEILHPIQVQGPTLGDMFPEFFGKVNEICR